MKPTLGLFLFLVSALVGRAETLETASYWISVDDRSPEGDVSSTDVHSVIVDKRTREIIKLVGRTVHALGKDGVTPSHFIGYEFKAGETEYFIYSDGRLNIARAHQSIANEIGEWKSAPSVAASRKVRSPLISEKKALALVQSLPEFVALKNRLKENVNVDGPLSMTPPPLYQVSLGTEAWQIDVYTIVHDDAETAHANRWAFFRVNATHGDIWVEDFDYDSGRFTLRSLEDWRLERKRRN